MTVGTRIKIITTTSGCYGAEGMVGVVTSKHHTDGLLSDDPGYNVLVDNGRVWRINNDAKVEVLSTKMPKLKVGMFGVTKAGKLFVVTEMGSDKVLAYAYDGEKSGFDYPKDVGIKRLIEAQSFYACKLSNERDDNIIWDCDERESTIKELVYELDRIKSKIAELREV
jgi:hypothetical protein